MKALVADLRSARGRKATLGKSAPVAASPDDAAVEDEAAATLGFEQDR